LAFITGRIVEAFYGCMPEFIGKQTLSYLVVEFKGITEQFIQKYYIHKIESLIYTPKF
jgi:hypothetical protein